MLWEGVRQGRRSCLRSRRLARRRWGSLGRWRFRSRRKLRRWRWMGEKLSEDKLVLVLGAGASTEFDLPSGAKLKLQIADFFTFDRDQFGNIKGGDRNAHRIISELGRNSSEPKEATRDFYDAAESIHRNMAIAQSIDNFLHTHSSNSSIVRLGKAAIAHLILAGEKASPLYVPNDNVYNRLNLKVVSQTWLGRLFTILTSGGDYEAFATRVQRIEFISFNYDRCVQQFFWHAVQGYFGKSSDDAAEFVRSLDISYVYGSVGEFKIGGLGFSTFGGTDEARVASQSIRTFTEGVSTSPNSPVARSLSGAKAVFFLGFGFHDLNLKALFSDNRFEVKGIFGTAKGLSDYTLQDVKEKLSSHLWRRLNSNYQDKYEFERIRLVDKTCAELIFEFERVF